MVIKDKKKSVLLHAPVDSNDPCDDITGTYLLNWLPPLRKANNG